MYDVRELKYPGLCPCVNVWSSLDLSLITVKYSLNAINFRFL
jgi:hypothetical protein